MKLLLLIIMTLFLLGCSPKTEYVYIKPKPYDFVIVKQPKPRTIRVYKEDVTLYTKYIKHFREIIKFYEMQIKDYIQDFNRSTNAK